MSDEVKKEDEIALTVQVPVSVSWDQIRNLLCCALEGGSNYWYVIHSFRQPKDLKPWRDSTTIFRHLDYPCQEGGELVIHDRAGGIKPSKIKRVNRETLVQGLKVMAEKYPKSFGDFITENDDAWTGDVFLQCVCFGEVIFG